MTIGSKRTRGPTLLVNFITRLCLRSTNRYILASTEELHARIDELLERTRDLEVALEASYALHATQTHGLLKKELLVEGSRLALERDHDEEEVPVAAFGTLKSEHSHLPSAFGPYASFPSIPEDWRCRMDWLNGFVILFCSRCTPGPQLYKGKLTTSCRKRPHP